MIEYKNSPKNTEDLLFRAMWVLREKSLAGDKAGGIASACEIIDKYISEKIKEKQIP